MFNSLAGLFGLMVLSRLFRRIGGFLVKESAQRSSRPGSLYDPNMIGTSQALRLCAHTQQLSGIFLLGSRNVAGMCVEWCVSSENCGRGRGEDYVLWLGVFLPVDAY
jgi:hypothetical protein